MRSCTQRRLWSWSRVDARRVESVTAALVELEVAVPRLSLAVR
jgi:hypothetical protein